MILRKFEKINDWIHRSSHKKHPQNLIFFFLLSLSHFFLHLGLRAHKTTTKHLFSFLITCLFTFLFHHSPINLEIYSIIQGEICFSSVYAGFLLNFVLVVNLFFFNLWGPRFRFRFVYFFSRFLF